MKHTDQISRKALVKALLEERDKYPPMLEERYSLGAKVPQRFNQAVRAGIRKALRVIETAPAEPPKTITRLVIKYGFWIETGKRGFHGMYFWDTPMPRCSRCLRTPPAHEQEHHEHGGTTVSVHWHKTNCCPHCGAVMLDSKKIDEILKREENDGDTVSRKEDK